MKKFTRKLIMSLVIPFTFFSPGIVMSNTPVTAQYIFVDYTGSGVLSFTVNNDTATRPACATSGRYAVNLSNGAGQAIYTLLLASRATGSPFTVVGTGACDIWGNVETIAYVQF